MKGVVFNILEDFIVEGWGQETYEELLDMCPLHSGKTFVAPETYPDTDLFMIVQAACDKLGISVDDALVAFGRYMFPKLAAKYPVFLQGHTHPRSFLHSLHDVIHVEVRKLLKQADPPSVACKDIDDNQMSIDYQSRRKLCPLFSGLLSGVATHFQSPMQFHETQCMRHGADTCRFHLQFSPDATVTT